MNKIPINHKDVTNEVAARITKAVASSYDCSVDIDYHNGRQKAVFVGDEELKPHIVDEALGLNDD